MMPPVVAAVRSPDKLALDVSLDRVRDALKDPASLVWVDLHADGPRHETEHVLRDVFAFHPLTIDDCYNRHIDPPKVDDYGDYLFVIIHDVTYDAATQSLSTSELDLYIGANYVVSVHQQPIHAIDEVRRWVEQHTPVLDRGAGFLAHGLIDVVVDDFHPVVEEIDDVLARIEEEVIDRPARETLERLLTLKRNTQRLRRTMLPQRDVVNRFARLEFAHLIPETSVMYFRDIYDHTVRVGESIDALRDMADSALNTYLSSVNNRTNEVMKTLAIVAVIFLPLTLIAGIYGTNFEDVPEYDWRFGYPGMLLLMVIVTAGLLAWFRFRRWF